MPRIAQVLLIGVATLSPAACNLDNLLTVKTPGVVSATDLTNPDNASLLVVSAQTNFACALGMYIVAEGNIGTELAWGDLNTFDYDRRTFTAAGGGAYATSTCQGGGAPGVYTPLSTAHYTAELAHNTISKFTTQQVPNRADLLAVASAYEAYSALLLGEGMCGASIDVGPELTRGALWQLAESTFTRAINEAQAAKDDSTLALSYLGRARARINLSQTNASEAAGAAGDAALVPQGFVQNAYYSGVDPGSSNYVYYWITEQIRSSVDSFYWNLSFAGVPDPRVSLTYTGLKAHDQITPLVTPNKYASRETPIPIARWAEAQLIIAEVAGGQTAVNIINALHAAAGLPSFASSDPTAIHNQIIEERGRELFLEGQHLNDMIRFGLPFLPATGTPYKEGSNYGSMTCLPYPFAESQNR